MRERGGSRAAWARGIGQAMLALLALALGGGAEGAAEQVQIPPGFRVEVFATGLGGPRFMAWSPSGDLTVSIPRRGQVVLLPDRDRDGRADRSVVFASDLDRPHGLAWRDGWLYVAETGRVVRLRDADGDGRADRQEVVVADLPAGGGHWTRTLTFGPDGKMYVSVGSSCNVCEEADSRRAAILQFNADGSGGRIFARGIRNAVGLTWHPGTGRLWATNNGRDWLGDDLPPDTVITATDGAHYGWPHCHAGDLPDPDFPREGFCPKTAPPAVKIQAHSAPLGLTFYTGTQFPQEYRGNLFVALHGSWNRSVPVGYKVVRVRLGGAAPVVEDFATGWLAGSRYWGRPVDLAVAPDGALFLSDDGLGVVYRITYRGG